MIRRRCCPLLIAAAVLAGMLAGVVGCSEPAKTLSPTVVFTDEPAMDTTTDFLFLHYDGAILDRLRPNREGAGAWVDSLMEALSLREKIGQLFIMEAGAERANAPVPPSSIRAARKYSVGGFLVSRLLEPEQVYRQTQYLQKRANVPLFFAADYERGAGRFANNFTELPSNMAVGATRSSAFAGAAARLAALESRALGVNLMFAPVVDVNNNPENPIINIRSYGGKPELVGRMGAAYVRAAEDFGMLTTLKHFPGHGDVSTDTHAEMATVGGSWEELQETELKPYKMILGQKEVQPTAVMGAHLWVRAFNEAPTPATLSREVLGGLLRDSLGFRGLVVTDDIKMGALQNGYSPAARVVRPLEIGADVVLTPEDLPEAIQAVESAVQDGRFSEEALDRSVRRILRAKARAGLHNDRVPDRAALDYLLEEPRGQALAQRIADASITRLGTTPALPLAEDGDAALIQLSNYEGAESIDTAMDTLAARLAPYARDTMRLGRAPSAADQQAALEAARNADAVVLALHLRLTTSRGSAGLFAEQRPFVRELLRQETPVVLVTLGNPYAVATFSGADAFVVAYDQTVAGINAVAAVLKGEQPAPGRLPIAVGDYDFGAGQRGGVGG